MTPEGPVVAKCCSSESCNGGTPAQIPAGVYWIQVKGSDKYVVAQADGSLAEKEFTNKDDMKFDISHATDAGSDLNGQFSIAPHGIVDDDGTAWTMLEVGKHTYMITGKTSMGLMPIVGRDFFERFVLTRTVGGNWEVGWRDKRCPADASREIPSAKDPTTCMNKCKQDAACKEIIEWDNDNDRCFFVTKDCPQDNLRDGVGFILYKSKCAGVTCPAISQCHLEGMCDVTTGSCSTPLKTDDAGCDDGDFRTTQDVCKAGTCAGTDLCSGVVCAAASQCHDVGTCNYQTGQCEEKFKPGGSPCDDEDTNTKDDQCNLGMCKGIDPCAGVTCEALDQCHEPGMCLFETGTCDDKRKPDGTTCDDGDSTTKDDKCIAGVCRGKGKCEDITCAAMGPCYAEGTCDPETGRCDDPFAPQGQVCDDESDFTVDDVCDGQGECFGKDLCEGVTCADLVLDQCMSAGACDRLTGKCTSQPKQEGVTCDDGDEKTVNDVCVAGSCKGEDLCANVQCAAINGCHEEGECNAQTGLCIDKVKPDEEACDDENEFTDNDKCYSGVCVGTKIGQEEPDLTSDWFEEAEKTAEEQITVMPKMISSMGTCTKLFTNWQKQKKNGKSQDLRKHQVSCPPNQVLKGWKLKKDGEKLQIMYTCCDLSLLMDTCEEKDTGFASNKKGSFSNLAPHNVQCSAGQVMSGWQLQNTGKGQIKFLYTCCGVKSPGLQACETDKTEATSDEGGDTTLLWKHKAYCSKGEVMTGWKYVLKEGKKNDKCDWQCYLDRYKDLRQAFGATNTKKAKKHWKEFGEREKRDCTCPPPGKFSVKYDCCKAPEIEEPTGADAGLLQYPQHQSLINLHDSLRPYEDDEDEFGREDETAEEELEDEDQEEFEDEEGFPF